MGTHKEETVHKPQAFFLPEDFHVVLSVLGAYLAYLQQLKQESTRYQDLYTKVEIAVFTIDAGNPETLNLSHEEVGLLLKALMDVDTALALQRPAKDDLERYKPLMKEQLARVQQRLLAAFPVASREKRARFH